MPRPGTSWFHIVINAKGTWLHGDPRGFRSHKHYIHSTGDYKKPPPQDEHAGLLVYHKQRSTDAIAFSKIQQGIIGGTLRDKAMLQNHQLVAIAVDEHHAHLLTLLPTNESTKIVGTWKQAASHAVRDQLPGQIWAQRLHAAKVRDRKHQLKVFDYIVKHGKHGAWVWTFRDGS